MADASEPDAVARPRFDASPLRSHSGCESLEVDSGIQDAVLAQFQNRDSIPLLELSMPPDALKGVLAKVERAKKHILNLNSAHELLREANQDLIGYKDDTKSRRRVYYVLRDPTMPPDFALIAGDVVQNLRSALDHLAYALCLAAGKPIPQKIRRDIYFPVSASASDYMARTGTPIQTLAETDAVKAIDKIEPYKGGNGEILWKISKLNITDKHRLLVTVLLQKPSVEVGTLGINRLRAIPPEVAKRLEGVKFPIFLKPADTSPLKAGDEVFSVPIEGIMNDEQQFAFPVAVHEPEILGTKSLLKFSQEATDFVSGIVPAFYGFF